MSERPNLLAPHVRANPYPLYATLRRERPVCQVDPGGVWAISRYDDVLFTLRHPEIFSSSGFRRLVTPPWLPRNPTAHALVMRDPPDHTHLRALVSRAFAPSAMARLEGRIHEIAAELVERLVEHGEADFIAEFAAPLPARIIAEILGLDPALHVHFKRWGDDLGAATVATTDPARIAEIQTSVRELESYLVEVIEARRRHPTDDFVSGLLQPDASGQRLGEDDLLGFLSLILAAGFETTTALLASALSLLGEQPADFQRLRDSPALVPPYLEEVLRYDGPVHGIARMTTQEVVLGGVRLPAESMVLCLLASANRDESRFPDPDRFDPGRPNQKDLAFGHGIHFCLGAALARMEARISLAVLLERCARIERVPGEVRWSDTLVTRCPVTLPFRFYGRSMALAA